MSTRFSWSLSSSFLFSQLGPLAFRRELIGEFFREGTLYTQERVHVQDHDFRSLADGIAIPHGSASIDSDLVISAGLAGEPGIEGVKVNLTPLQEAGLLRSKRCSRAVVDGAYGLPLALRGRA